MAPLELGNLLLDPSALVVGAGLLGLLGLFIWLLVRKRVRRVRLPTIRIMRLESRVLPQLVLRLPPLFAFLCFLSLVLVITAFTLRPRTQIFTPFEPEQTRVHLLIDLSPSVSAHVSQDALVERVTGLWESLKDRGRVTLSTSHGAEVLEPENKAAVEAALRQKSFHRGGLRLGSAIKILIEELGETDRLFIVADRDQHTWAGFNWRYLLDQMDVTFVDLAGDDAGQKTNVFINEARHLAGGAVSRAEWEVELARTGGAGELGGVLEASYMGRALGSFPYTFAPGRQRVTVRAEWPLDAMGQEASEAASEGTPVVFRLQAADDALAADNEYRVEPVGMRRQALVLSGAGGERMLDEPAGQLGVTLDVLGFRVRRQDVLVQPGPDPLTYPLIIIIGGSGVGVDRFCPKSLELARQQWRDRQGARSAATSGMPRVWLAPAALDADYRELCQCYARLLLSESPGAPAPEFCSGVESRNQWVQVLPSIGAKQVGGDVGDASKALALAGHDQRSGLQVLAFTVPLVPSRATGINHAALPILVKELLAWQGLIDSKGELALAAWPRVDDLAAALWRPAADGGDAADPGRLARIRSGNVPVGESLLVPADPAQLPPRWTSQNPASEKQLPAKKDREDPLPWLRLAALLAVTVTGLEGLVGLVSRLAGAIRRRPEPLLILGLMAAMGAPRAEARVEFAMVGYGGGSAMALSRLAREVSQRTSIELSPAPRQLPQLGPQALLEPWLWVQDVRAVSTESGRLHPDVATWVRRGGFLVIEQALPAATLDRLTVDLERGTGDHWLPLPPDHELMRSFYLLDALPACNNEIWRGFHHDGRLALITVPYGFLASVADQGVPPPCPAAPDAERSVRIFVNLTMVALATDYKKDQIHLPEILKRLR